MKVKLYKNQKHSLYYIQTQIGVAKDTLYRYANGYRNIDNMSVKMVLDIAKIEEIEPNKLIKEIKEYQKNKFMIKE